MQRVVTVRTDRREALYDITDDVAAIVRASGVVTGTANVYAQGATAAVMVQENWDASVPRDVVHLLEQLIPRGVWEHDRQDGNGDAHLKAGVVGPSETIPVIDGALGLSRWQDVFLCEFDGPRAERRVVVTVVDAERDRRPD